MTILDAMPFRASLDAARSRDAAGSIGIGHLERCAAKVLDIVDLATGHQLKADRVDVETPSVVATESPLPLPLGRSGRKSRRSRHRRPTAAARQACPACRR